MSYDHTLIRLAEPGSDGRPVWFAMTPHHNPYLKLPLPVGYLHFEQPNDVVHSTEGDWCRGTLIAKTHPFARPVRLTIQPEDQAKPPFEVVGEIDDAYTRAGDSQPVDQVGPQGLMMAVLRSISHESMDGVAIAADLERHRDWWRAMLPGRLKPGITLRDLDDDVTAIDGLWLWVHDEHAEEAMALAQAWPGAMPSWIEHDDRHELGWFPRPGEGRVLRCWWD